jgi:hypothetical protein
MAAVARTPVALVLLAAASLLSSWNQISAPAGLLVGLAVSGLCIVERRRRGAFDRWTGAGLALALAGVLASALVLATLAGGTQRPGGAPIVDEVPSEGREEQLRRAAERTRPARDAARDELDRLEPAR